MRTIVSGNADGKALVSSDPISFYGSVDPKSGKVIESEHDLSEKSIRNRILVFPRGKGSTVGSYKIYEMAKLGTAPKGMIVEKAEPIIVVGCVLADIPLLEGEVNIKSDEHIKIEEGKLKNG